MSDTQVQREEGEAFMTALEVGLKDDSAGTFRDSIRSAIAEQQSAINAALRRGAAPKEYGRLSTLKQGLDSADVILDRFWAYYNQ